ncbi:MAG TPA: hypothetical protein VIK80_10370 [Flavihumibacter sp.]|jgi:hypothetical protein
MKSLSPCRNFGGLGVAMLLFAIISVVACSKGKEGPVGPQGPQGPQGPIGTANVIYSDWFKPNTYTATTAFGTRYLSYEQNAPAITEDILNTGTVIVFGKLHGYNENIWPRQQISAMPITIMFMQANVMNIDNWTALVTVGKITIRLVNSTNTYITINNSHEFRYVIIPGGQGLGVVDPRLEMIQDQIKNGIQVDYRELAELANIPD